MSETIHLATVDQMLDYGSIVGKEKAIQANEALGEGISNIVATNLLIELGFPNAKKFGDDVATRIASGEKYSQLPQSIAWIRRNGVQQAFDLYKESPKKFVEAITK